MCFRTDLIKYTWSFYQIYTHILRVGMQIIVTPIF